MSDTCAPLLYADDTTITTSGNSIRQIENTVSSDVKHVSDWCDGNDMVLSGTESVAMLFQARQRKSKTIIEKALAVEITDIVLLC